MDGIDNDSVDENVEGKSGSGYGNRTEHGNGNGNSRVVVHELILRPSSRVQERRRRQRHGSNEDDEDDGDNANDGNDANDENESGYRSELAQGENWLMLIERERSVLDFSQTQASMMSQSQQQQQQQQQPPPPPPQEDDGDDGASTAIYPSIMSGYNEKYPTHGCYVCLDVDDRILTIKDMRRPVPTTMATIPSRTEQRGDESVEHSVPTIMTTMTTSSTNIDQHNQQEQEYDERPMGILHAGTSQWRVLPRRQLRLLHPGDKICCSLDLDSMNNDIDQSQSNLGFVYEYRRTTHPTSLPSDDNNVTATDHTDFVVSAVAAAGSGTGTGAAGASTSIAFPDRDFVASANNDNHNNKKKKSKTPIEILQPYTQEEDVSMNLTQSQGLTQSQESTTLYQQQPTVKNADSSVQNHHQQEPSQLPQIPQPPHLNDRQDEGKAIIDQLSPHGSDPKLRQEHDGNDDDDDQHMPQNGEPMMDDETTGRDVGGENRRESVQWSSPPTVLATQEEDNNQDQERMDDDDDDGEHDQNNNNENVHNDDDNSKKKVDDYVHKGTATDSNSNDDDGDNDEETDIENGGDGKDVDSDSDMTPKVDHDDDNDDEDNDPQGGACNGSQPLLSTQTQERSSHLNVTTEHHSMQDNDDDHDDEHSTHDDQTGTKTGGKDNDDESKLFDGVEKKSNNASSVGKHVAADDGSDSDETVLSDDQRTSPKAASRKLPDARNETVVDEDELGSDHRHTQVQDRSGDSTDEKVNETQVVLAAGIDHQETLSTTCAVGELTQVEKPEQESTASRNEDQTHIDDTIEGSMSPSFRRETGQSVVHRPDESQHEIDRSHNPAGLAEPNNDTTTSSEATTNQNRIIEQQQPQHQVTSQSFLQETCSEDVMPGSANDGDEPETKQNSSAVNVATAPTIMAENVDGDVAENDNENKDTISNLNDEAACHQQVSTQGKEQTTEMFDEAKGLDTDSSDVKNVNSQKPSVDTAAVDTVAGTVDRPLSRQTDFEEITDPEDVEILKADEPNPSCNRSKSADHETKRGTKRKSPATSDETNVLPPIPGRKKRTKESSPRSSAIVDTSATTTRTSKRSLASHSQEETPTKLRSILNSPAGSSIRIMTSGVEIGSVEKKWVRSIGASLIEKLEDAAKATHLIVGTKVLRTPKLMIAMCNTGNIVTMDWLEHSARAEKALPTEEFLALSGLDVEKQYSFSLRQSLSRAGSMRSRGESLFGGYSIFLPKGVAGNTGKNNRTPPSKDFKLILQGGGATTIQSLPCNGDLSNVIIVTSKLAKESKKQLAAKNVAAAISKGAMSTTTEALFQTFMTQNLDDLSMG